MNAALHIKKEGKGQTFYTIYNGKKKKCVIERPTSKLTVGSLQRFLDGYLHTMAERLITFMEKR